MVYSEVQKLGRTMKLAIDVRKEIKNKFCPDLKCHYSELWMLAPLKYESEFGKHDWVVYSDNVEEIIFLSDSAYKIEPK